MTTTAHDADERRVVDDLRREFHKVRSTRESVVQAIVRGIRLGKLLPGDRLPAERDLAVELGVSRETVRDAIKTLVDVGYIETRRGRYGGSFVCDDWTTREAQSAPAQHPSLTGADVEDAGGFDELVGAIEFIETSIVRRLALTPIDEGPREQLVLAYEAARTAPMESYHAYDTAFHLTLASLLGLPSIEAMAEQNWLRLNGVLLAAPVFACSPQASNAHHWELLRAIQAGDADSADRAIRYHVRALTDLARSYL